MSEHELRHIKKKWSTIVVLGILLAVLLAS